MTSDASVARAEYIAEKLNKASTRLLEAILEMRIAVTEIERDGMPHNAESPKDILGALRVDYMALSTQVQSWDGFADARKRQRLARQ